MELDIFIKESLLQIVNEIHQANAEIEKELSVKNPFLLEPGSQKEHDQGIKFDVAVTSHTVQSTDGKAKFKLAIFEAGLGGDDKVMNQSVSRIQFKVNIKHYLG